MLSLPDHYLRPPHPRGANTQTRLSVGVLPDVCVVLYVLARLPTLLEAKGGCVKPGRFTTSLSSLFRGKLAVAVAQSTRCRRRGRNGERLSVLPRSARRPERAPREPRERRELPLPPSSRT